MAAAAVNAAAAMVEGFRRLRPEASPTDVTLKITTIVMMGRNPHKGLFDQDTRVDYALRRACSARASHWPILSMRLFGETGLVR